MAIDGSKFKALTTATRTSPSQIGGVWNRSARASPAILHSIGRSARDRRIAEAKTTPLKEEDREARYEIELLNN